MKWVLRAGLVLLLLILAGTMGLYWFVKQPVPNRSGAVTAAGLSAPVEIFYDSYGVPQLFAQNTEDLFFAQGYVHGSERLFQMMLSKWAAEGRLSEMVAPELIERDMFVRTLGVPEYAERFVALCTPRERALLESYSRGVNLAIEQTKGRLPLEFLLAGCAPEPWTPEATAGLVRLMAWRLSDSWEGDRLWWRLSGVLTREEMAALLPPWPGPAVLPALPPATVPPSPLPGGGGASNAFALSGEMSTTGRPIVANDPHLWLDMPAQWYEQGLHCPDFEGTGFGVPGIPLLALGRTKAVAWGITVFPVDDGDFLLVRPDPADSGRYIAADSSLPFCADTERFNLKNGAVREVVILRTVWGPVVSSYLGESPVVVYHWRTDSGVGFVEGVLGMLRAGSSRELLDAAGNVRSPALNYVTGDTAGGLGYAAMGLVVKETLQSYLPQPAPPRTGGYVEPRALPRGLKDEGFYVSANNPPLADYPWYITVYWAPGYRAQRLTFLLSEKRGFDAAAVREIQTDLYDPHAREFAGYLERAPLTDDARDGPLMNAVREWDYRHDPDSPGAAAWNALWYSLLYNAYYDRLGDELWADLVVWKSFPAFGLRRLLTAPSGLFGVENSAELVNASVAEAESLLAARLGPPQRWRWGALHRAIFTHPFGDRLGVFNAGPVEVAGGSYTVNRNGWSGGGAFTSTSGVSLRAVYDLSHPDSNFTVLPPGQGANLLDPYRTDQLSLWQRGGYKVTPLTREAIEKAAVSSLRLVPAHQASLVKQHNITF